MKSRTPASRRPGRAKSRRPGPTAVMAAAASSVLLSAGGAGEAAAAADARRGAPDLAERVASLRQTVAGRAASGERTGEWVDRVLSPRIDLAQEKKWNKWNNG